ncbi:hypothetical protein CLF_110560 [Clonorchis sinensis]|uniref:Uncharacterized protein n=1 Tax=Clonorchis sinensis TaxID=79923 RepID=G7YTN3_CLOSI|nr:hypothetical protein CLF_110560 [Clonorchis sinensis]
MNFGEEPLVNTRNSIVTSGLVLHLRAEQELNLKFLFISASFLVHDSDISNHVITGSRSALVHQLLVLLSDILHADRNSVKLYFGVQWKNKRSRFKFRGRTNFFWTQVCGSSRRIPIASAIDSSLDRTRRDQFGGIRCMNPSRLLFMKSITVIIDEETPIFYWRLTAIKLMSGEYLSKEWKEGGNGRDLVRKSSISLKRTIKDKLFMKSITVIIDEETPIFYWRLTAIKLMSGEYLSKEWKEGGNGRDLVRKSSISLKRTIKDKDIEQSVKSHLKRFHGRLKFLNTSSADWVNRIQLLQETFTLRQKPYCPFSTVLDYSFLSYCLVDIHRYTGISGEKTRDILHKVTSKLTIIIVPGHENQYSDESDVNRNRVNTFKDSFPVALGNNAESLSRQPSAPQIERVAEFRAGVDRCCKTHTDGTGGLSTAHRIEVSLTGYRSLDFRIRVISRKTQGNGLLVRVSSVMGPRGKHWTRVSLSLELSSAYPVAVPGFKPRTSDMRGERVITTHHQRTLDASEFSRLNRRTCSRLSDEIGVPGSSNDDPVAVLVVTIIIVTQQENLTIDHKKSAKRGGLRIFVLPSAVGSSSTLREDLIFPKR